MTSIAIATCAALPEGDEDAALLRTALLERGVRADWLVWNDDGVDWADYELIVIRSTWDYTIDRAAYLSWIASVGTVVNPAPAVRWNTDKTYLRDLSAAGLPVVPTTWAEPGQAVDLPEQGEFVVKPSVGAGSTGVGRFVSGDRQGALAHAARLHEAGRVVMVQPYLAEVDTAGETALIYTDGTFSHAIRKAAMLPAASVNDLLLGYSRRLYVEEKITAREPDAAELALGERVIAYVRDRFGDLLYTRVDLLPGADGPVIIELELVEPSLFLEFADGATDRFADAIARRLTT
jgi:hypothetical protein